ncbi:hypothetical protein Emin_1361 [Elusimicrobium minutum Pei191]|uniref:Transferrin-binding protein B C-lobe/N-lobe beta barrel domain-containing protein n=1 Tax=Elusimicrobium minutum (strain Pei191) TaxID=445932 RepID=B2KEG5_ELUMP|nr:hypothetical protein [Elusimicrobium minutum]ACC98911.1 hypothetical protein Emin_1361 [Elusimicrobium minutum Pei191]
MSKITKILFILLSGAFVLTACDSKSEPVSAQIFSVLNALPAGDTITLNGTQIMSLDSTTTTDGKGGIAVYAKELAPTVTLDANGDVAFITMSTPLIFQKDNLSSYPLTAFVFTSDFSGTSAISTGGSVVYTAKNKLAVGGAKMGLKHGDFGYWREVVTANINNSAVGTHYDRNYIFTDAFVIADSTKKPDLTALNNNDSNHSFKGNVLGSVTLMKDNGVNPETAAGYADLTGGITLSANFKDQKVSASMDLNVDGHKWYSFETDNTSQNLNLADGSFNNSGGSLKVTSTPSGIDSKYESTGSYTSSFQGNFYGEDGKIPDEALGIFNINFQGYNGAGFRPVVSGAFGVKK